MQSMGFTVFAGFVVYVFFQCDFILTQLGRIQGKLRFAFLESLENLHPFRRTGSEFRMIVTGQAFWRQNKNQNELTTHNNNIKKHPGCNWVGTKLPLCYQLHISWMENWLHSGSTEIISESEWIEDCLCLQCHGQSWFNYFWNYNKNNLPSLRTWQKCTFYQTKSHIPVNFKRERET